MPETLPDPGACRWCGIPRRGHFQQYVEAVGWHKHTEPTDAQRLERMKARRAARLAPRRKSQFPLDETLTVTFVIEDTLTPVLERIQAALNVPGSGAATRRASDLDAVLAEEAGR